MKNLIIKLILLSATVSGCSHREKIDRYDLVTRHNIEITSPDSLNSLTVGNGEFAFTADITGLQTFPEVYRRGVPLGTMSNWGWHWGTNPDSFSLDDTYRQYEVHGRKVDYIHRFTSPSGSRAVMASDHLRRYPFRVHLGQIGLVLSDENDSQLIMNLIKEPRQKLDLWKGEISSRFFLEGEKVTVTTICHPGYDMISSRISSSLVAEKKLRVRISFPDKPDSPSGFGFNFPVSDTVIKVSQNEKSLVLRRVMSDDDYYIKIFLDNQSAVVTEDNKWYIAASPGDTVLEFSTLFSDEPPILAEATFDSTSINSSISWKKFWLTGGAVDFSGSIDPRASELERRVILSQYLTKVQCSGSLPPAETGLTYNSWYGKFHLEMHWWHGVHFGNWHRGDILEKQMDYYFRIYEKAEATAIKQGYQGVRWPKMTDPEGNESPSGVGTYLIWQQPHIIYFAELLYQNASDRNRIIEKYKELVFSTADFMASYAWSDTTSKRYSLGPVLISAQESLRLETTVNPTFELVYWYWGLRTANEWKRRAGEEENKKWKDVAEGISPLPVIDNVYLCSEDTRDTWINPRYMSDHPIISGILGMMPSTPLVDRQILANSLDSISRKWNWNSCWGWDFPLLAMSAASVGRPEQAVDFLMMEAPKNRYLVNGHNYQDARLTIYLPGNGGLLSAVAMMCTSDRFPGNGKWKVKWENLDPLLR